MSLILGLDLGSSSIGWAVVRYSNSYEDLAILGMGSKIIPFDGKLLSNFNKGSQISINSARTAMRTARKLLDRYAIRRQLLLEFFAQHHIEIPKELMTLNRLELWKLRAEAARAKITLPELARVLYMINQKRGYKATKADLDPENKKQVGFVAQVRSRYAMLVDSGNTVGQWAYENMLKNPEFRVKDNIFPRTAYIDEFDRIMEVQKQFYSDVLTDENIKHLRDYIIFYQRPLKSCKHLVSRCEFEQFSTKDANGKEITVVPKVAHRSNPLFQIFRIWQSVNNISLHNRYNEKLELNQHQKNLLVTHLLSGDILTVSKFNEIIWFIRHFG